MAHTRNNIGSVSHGTLLSEDLIEAFIYELRQQKPLHRSHRKVIRDVEAMMSDAQRVERLHSETLSWDDMAESSGCVDMLIDALNDYAPEGFYFGTHPGDGSDFGFWLSESYVEDFDGLKVDDWNMVPRGYTGLVLHVSDHGNPSLYLKSRSHTRELWSLV